MDVVDDLLLQLVERGDRLAPEELVLAHVPEDLGAHTRPAPAHGVDGEDDDRREAADDAQGERGDLQREREVAVELGAAADDHEEPVRSRPTAPGWRCRGRPSGTQIAFRAVRAEVRVPRVVLARVVEARLRTTHDDVRRDGEARIALFIFGGAHERYFRAARETEVLVRVDLRRLVDELEQLRAGRRGRPSTRAPPCAPPSA